MKTDELIKLNKIRNDLGGKKLTFIELDNYMTKCGYYTVLDDGIINQIKQDENIVYTNKTTNEADIQIFFNIVYNNESPIKFIKKGLSLVYPSENVGIRLDNTDKGSEIIYNYLKQGSEEIVRSIDEFYINAIVYYHRNERIKQRELRKSMKL